MNHRLDFDSYLNPEKVIKETVEKIRDQTFLSQLIQKYFLSNDNFVVIRQLMASKEIKEE